MYIYINAGVLAVCFDYDFHYKFVINNRDLDSNIVTNIYLLTLIKWFYIKLGRERKRKRFCQSLSQYF